MAKKTNEERVNVRALNNLSGRYLLPYSKGDVFTISPNAAKEMTENKDVELV